MVAFCRIIPRRSIAPNALAALALEKLDVPASARIQKLMDKTRLRAATGTFELPLLLLAWFGVSSARWAGILYHPASRLLRLLNCSNRLQFIKWSFGSR